MMRIYRKVLSVILCAAVIAGVIPATVSIKAAAENSVKYLDANGVEQICGDASGASSSTVWSDGWYVADTASINNRITVNGVVNLILRDGCDFNANAGITVSRGNTLNIYAQSEGDGAGKLTATGQEYAAGIGGNEEYDYIPGGCVTINGGSIYANGGTYAAGIGGGFDSEFGGDGCTVTVNGGSVYATGGIKGAGIGGGCHISGGYAYRGGRGGSLTVNKGVITATAGAEASSIGGGSGGDAASVSLNAACIAIKETKDANVNLTLNDSPANAFQNLSSVYIVVKNEHYTDFDCYHTESVPATCTEFGKEKTICADCGMIFTTDNPEKAPLGHTPVLGQDGTYSCSTCGFTGVPYITYEYGITAKYKMCESFIEVTPETVNSVGTIWGNDNFYLIKGTVNVSSRITVTGTANIILADGCLLDAQSGIDVFDGNTLNIFAQSSGNSMGSLIADGNPVSATGIGGRYEKDKNCGTIVINGGNINACGADYNAAIGNSLYSDKGTVTINGGNINAKATKEAGAIGCGSESDGSGFVVNINGGTITASSVLKGAGIGGGSYNGSTAVNVYISNEKCVAVKYYESAGGTYRYYGSCGKELQHFSTLYIKMSEHTFGTKTAERVAPTCTEYGKIVHSCTVCGVKGGTETDNSAKPLGHAPVKAEGGIWKCSRCHRQSAENYVYKTSDNVQHNYLLLDCIPVNSATLAFVGSTWGNGEWYIVDTDTTVTDRINISGVANIVVKDGCSLTAVKGICVSNGNTLNIYSQSFGDDQGVIIADAEENNAAIGSDKYYRAGVISIYGCNIKATGGRNAAGIGGGAYGGSCGTVNINGGNIKATGGHSGSGIGGGFESSDGTVNINSGIIESTASFHGAGIGGGSFGTCGTVNINGGDIKATGEHGGSGIGGGAYGLYGTVNINGGNINATGGDKGAGIGSGLDSEKVKVVINGGDIEAIGKKGAAIGAGSYDKYGCDVTVNGGKINAICDTDGEAPGIGSSYLGSGTGIDTGTLVINEGEVYCEGNPCVGNGENGVAVNIEIGGECQFVAQTPESTEEIEKGDLSWGEAALNYNTIYFKAFADHDIVYVDNNDDTHTVTCSQCSYTELQNHCLGEVIPEIPATCKSTGVKEHCVCSLCDAITDVNGEAINDLTIPASDMHNFGELTAEVSPTCQETGTKAHRSCSVCGLNVDADGNVIDDLTIPKTDHVKRSEEPDGVTDAGDEYWRCANCGNIIFANGALYESYYIYYTDDGKVKTNVRDSYIVVNESNIDSLSVIGNDNWYVFTGDFLRSGDRFESDKRWTVEGTANIILQNGLSLIMDHGINVTEGNTLNIYAQTVCVDNTTGSIDINSEKNGCAGIGGTETEGPGNINIHGGCIVINNGSVSGAGIGCGSVSGENSSIKIYGGEVHVYGGENSAGIGGTNTAFFPEITINGGSISTYSIKNAPAISCGKPTGNEVGTLTVNSGTLKCRGNNHAAIGQADPLINENIIINPDLAIESGKNASADNIESLYYSGQQYVCITSEHGDNYICGLKKISGNINKGITVTARDSKGNIMEVTQTEQKPVYYIDNCSEEGEYTLTASCDGAVQRTYIVDSDGGKYMRDVELCGEFDLNDDRQYTAADYQAAVQSALANAGKVDFEDMSSHDDYMKVVADVNGDKYIDVLDVVSVERRINGH